tara:strand:+ start:65 stop:250 length:186 start_codon:yes stop_codon:yes gene_type:complete
MVGVKVQKSEYGATASYVDHLGEIGPKALGRTESEAAFALGVMFGRNPEKFARELGEILGE